MQCNALHVCTTIVALAAFAFATPGGASAEPATAKACDFEWNPSYGIMVTAPEISARVVIFCDPAPMEHRVVMSLEKKDDQGVWVNQHSTDRDTRIPASSSSGGTGYDVRYFCTPGEWRGVLTVMGKTETGSFGETWFSPSRTVSSAQCPTG